MSKKKLSGRAIVIRLDRDEMRVALMGLGNALPQVQRTVVLPTPEGAVEDGMIARPDQLRETLRTVVTLPEFKHCHRVVFSLCSTQIISEIVTVPQMNEKKLEKMLHANMDVYFPVDVHDYNLVWRTIGKAQTEDGEEGLSVQLWAVPMGMLKRYYEVANDCGLNVAAVDWCGNSLVSAVDAEFISTSGKKAKKKVAAGARGKRRAEAAEMLETEEIEAPPTEIFLVAEQEHLMMTFVQEGQVRLQRLFQCGSDPLAELTEAAMVLEYYASRVGDRYGKASCILCGKLAEDPDFIEAVKQELFIPVRVLQCLPGPEWCLCLGASRTRTDFGSSDMNRKGALKRSMGSVWQYVLILVGGVALLASGINAFGSAEIWSNSLDGLRDTEMMLRFQSAASEGYADKYNGYVSSYNSYSSDWDTVFDSLRTYNDNLVLMLKELESILPDTVSVESIAIAEEGMGLEFACEDKITAAYLIMVLRELQYAELNDISDLSIGPGANAASMVPSIAKKQEDDMQAILEQMSAASGSGNGGTTEEAPPKEGSLSDDELEALLGRLGYDMDDLAEMDGDDIYDIEKEYDLIPDNGSYTTEKLLKEADFDERCDAIETMLNEDLFAQAYFADAVRDDFMDTENGWKFIGVILFDLYDRKDEVDTTAMMAGDVKAIREALPVLIEIITASEKNLAAAEKLIQDYEPDSLDKHYCAALMEVLDLGGSNDKDDEDDKKDEDDKDDEDDKESGSSSKLDDDELEDLAKKLIGEYIDAGGEASKMDPDVLKEAQKHDDQIVDYIKEKMGKDMADVFEKFFRDLADEDVDIDLDNPENTPVSDSWWEELEDFYQTGITDDEDFWKELEDFYRGEEEEESGGSDSGKLSDAELEDLANRLMAAYMAAGGDISKIDPALLLEAMQHKDQLEDYMNGSGGSGGTGGNFDDIFNDLFGTVGGGGGGVSAEPEDTRIHFAVALGYKEELIEAELERKGLSYEDKLPNAIKDEEEEEAAE